MSYTNNTIHIMDDERKETLVWKQLTVEVAYNHDNDNFELSAVIDGERHQLGEFDKSAEAVKSAERFLHAQEPARDGEKVYSFHQNNSGGYYTLPAKNIIVKDARDSEHATEIAIAAGMYLNGVSLGMDCDCCGDRWYGMDYEFNTVDEAIADARKCDFGDANVPMYIVVDDLDIEDTVLE